MNGFVYALDADTGKVIWRMQVDEHPQVRLTGSFTLYGDRLYVPAASWEEMSSSDPKYECCTFRGNLSALDAATGKVIWKTYTIADTPKVIATNNIGTKIFGPSGGGIWTTPTVDAKRGLIYVGTGNTFTGQDQPLTDSVLAIDMKTGKVRWSFRGTEGSDVCSGFCRFVVGCKNGPDLDFGVTMVLGHLPNGKDVVFAGHKSGVGFALDPDTGAIVWKYKAGLGGTFGGMQSGTTFDGKNVYFPNSDITSNSPGAPGGLHAVDPVTGQRLWYAPPVAPLLCGAQGNGCSGAQSAAVTAIPGAVFSGSNDGGMRAYSTNDGSILWTFDTNRDFQTVNGVPAKGASILGPGPVVVGGMLTTLLIALWVLPAIYSYITPRRLATPEEEDERIGGHEPAGVVEVRVPFAGVDDQRRGHAAAPRLVSYWITGLACWLTSSRLAIPSSPRWKRYSTWAPASSRARSRV
jgi:polyvinyl alcohol dehydrogenase (cytochrome)